MQTFSTDDWQLTQAASTWYLSVHREEREVTARAKERAFRIRMKDDYYQSLVASSTCLGDSKSSHESERARKRESKKERERERSRESA